MDHLKRGSHRSGPALDEFARGLEPDEAADYIAAMMVELRKLARAHTLEVLAYLLDMARLEADTTARSIRAAATQED